jgi:hypothetical protein
MRGLTDDSLQGAIALQRIFGGVRWQAVLFAPTWTSVARKPAPAKD